MTTETTPGPWHIDEARQITGTVTANGGHETRKICGVWVDYKNRGNPIDTAQANARLIAAAPDLLEACRAIATLNEGQGRLNMCEIAGMARAAIAKATN